MASITLTVDNTVAPRVLAAYGVSTTAELKTKLIADIKNKVVSHEAQVAHEAERAKLIALQQASVDAVTAAEAKASTEVTLS